MKFRIFMKNLTLSALGLALLTGCETMSPKIPVIPPNPTQDQKNELKRDYHLTPSGSTFFGMTGTQGNQAYPISQFGPVLGAVSPDAKRIYDAGSGKEFLGAVLGSAGGFAVGYTLGYGLQGGGFPSTNLWILGGGAAAMVGSYFIDDSATHDYEAALQKFNEDLDRKIEQSGN